MIDLPKLKQAVGDLDEDQVRDMLKQFIAGSPGKEDAQSVVTACQQGMEIVGSNYERGEYFVGDLIFAGELLANCIDKVRPLLGGNGVKKRGVIVLGTAEGDIHDIGKNIFKSMCEAAGFLVIDIGIDQPAEAFVGAVREHKPDILGLSGVLSISIDAMKNTADALAAEGLREGVKIIIGGNAVSEDARSYIGADAWSKNAAESVNLCREWME